MKESVKVQVAGVTFFVVTEDGKERTEEIARNVNTKINNLVLQTTNCTKMKAAALCAMDYCRESIEQKEQIEKLQQRIKKLEGDLARGKTTAESFLDLDKSGDI